MTELTGPGHSWSVVYFVIILRPKKYSKGNILCLLKLAVIFNGIVNYLKVVPTNAPIS